MLSCNSAGSNPCLGLCLQGNILVYAYTSIHIYIYMHACIYIYVHKHAYVHMSIRIYLYTFVYVSIYLSMALMYEPPKPPRRRPDDPKEQRRLSGAAPGRRSHVYCRGHEKCKTQWSQIPNVAMISYLNTTSVCVSESQELKCTLRLFPRL